MVRQVITAQQQQQTAGKGTLYTTYNAFKAETLAISDYASTNWTPKKTRYLGTIICPFTWA